MYDKLVRDIQSSIGNENLPFEMLVDLAAEDAEACEQLNERLSVINAVLKKGYAEEAIELAERKPNALDQFCQLDFPERNGWQDHLLANELDPPPQLSVEIAGEIEAAYDNRVRLAPLMKQYRMLALSKAPVAERLRCLERLAKSDPANPLWPVAVGTLQKERVVEIQLEFQRAQAQGDTEALSQLTAEIEGNKALNVPKRLATKITAGAKDNKRDEARQRMKGVAAKMNRAFSEFDLESGQQQQKQWQALLVDAQLEPSDELSQSVSEALLWLDDAATEERETVKFESAVKALEQSIDQNHPLSDLEKKRYQVEKFDRPIPELLLQRVNNRQQEMALAVQRKSRLRLGLIATAVAVSLAVLAYLVQSFHSNSVLQDSQQKLAAFLSAEEYQQGVQFFDGLPQTVKSDSALIGLNQQLIEKSASEVERVKAFSEAIVGIKIEGDLNASLDQAIAEADTFARSDSEKEKVEVFRKRLETDRLVRQRKRDKLFLADLEPIRERVKVALNSTDKMKAIVMLKAGAAELNQLIRQRNVRVDGMFGISIATKQNGEDLVELALKGVANLEQSATAEDAVSTMGKNLIPIDSYPEALTDFVTKFPSDPNSSDFRRSASENIYWQAFKAWKAKLKELKQVKFSALSSLEAQQLADGFEKMSAEMKVEDFQPNVVSLIKVLRERQKYTKAEQQAKRLKELFDRSGYKEIWVLSKQVGQYYLTAKPKIGSTTFQYFSANANQKKGVKKANNNPLKAPHGELGENLKGMIPSGGAIDYEGLFIELLDNATALGNEAAKPDPLVVFKFVERILNFGVFSGPDLADFAAGHRKRLQKLDVLQVDWKQSPIKNDNPDRQTAQDYLAQLAAELPTARAALKKRDEGYKGFGKLSRYGDLKIAGMLVRSGNQWKVSAIDKIKEGDRLIVFAPISDKSARLEVVGTYNRGMVKVKDSVFLQAGRPVYINQSQ